MKKDLQLTLMKQWANQMGSKPVIVAGHINSIWWWRWDRNVSWLAAKVTAAATEKINNLLMA